MAESQQLSNIADISGGITSTHNQQEKNYGIYRAIVVDNQDPKKSGRIKVWMPELNYTKVKENEGVWAYPCTPYAASNLEKKGQPVSDFGSLYVPPKDSNVFVFFENGDTSKPRYFGGLILEGAIPTENQAGEQYWNKHTVIKTPAKRMIFVSDDQQHDSCVIIRGRDRNG